MKTRGLLLLVLALESDVSIPSEVEHMGCGFGSVAPPRLSQTCFFASTAAVDGHPQARTFEPRYPLWTDGLHKRRWVLLAEGKQVDTRDMNEWRFPVGTVFFKEFSTPEGRRLETRMIKKIRGNDEEKWLFATYRWSEDQRDALKSEGERNVAGTEHRIPTQEQCIECHKGRVDRVLGFDLVQLSDGHGLIDRLKGDGVLPAVVPSGYQIPGDSTSRQALGYLHGNCAHCHNPTHGMAWPGWWVGMDFRVDVGATALEQQPTFRTTVNVEMFYDRKTVWKYRIKGGHPEQSAVFDRMSEVNPCLRMPPLGSQQIDHQGLGDVRNWIKTLGDAPIPTKDTDRRARDWVDFFGDKIHVFIIDLTGQDSRRAVHECPHLPHGYVRPPRHDPAAE